MIESATIRAAIATGNFGDESTDSIDETTLDYLCGILKDEDTYDDIDGLIETVQSLLGVEDRAVVERFVNSLAPSKSVEASMASSPPLQSLLQPSSAARAVHEHTVDESCEDDHSSTSNSSDDVTTPTVSQSSKDRKTARLQRKQEKKMQRQRKHKQHSKKSKGNNDEKEETDEEMDLQTKVAQINAASAQELEDIDDYASAWQDIKSKAEASGEEVVWG